jgi:hypothetical protein
MCLIKTGATNLARQSRCRGAITRGHSRRSVLALTTINPAPQRPCSVEVWLFTQKGQNAAVAPLPPVLIAQSVDRHAIG